MKIWNRIAKMSLRQLIELSYALIQKPKLIFPVLRATKRTLEICNTHYDRQHFANNKTNAFRHVLWNILICRNIDKKLKNDEKSVNWTKKVTDLYEKVTKNDILDELMDLHNNAIGRKVFLDKKGLNELEIVHLLQKMLPFAIKVNKKDDFDQLDDKLVYISEL